MSDKIEKIKPDKVRKRTIAPHEERKAYAEMIKYEDTTKIQQVQSTKSPPEQVEELPDSSMSE